MSKMGQHYYELCVIHDRGECDPCCVVCKNQSKEPESYDEPISNS